MAPRRKSLSFLTLRKNGNSNKTKENGFLHTLCDFSTKVNRRQSKRITAYPLKVSLMQWIYLLFWIKVCFVNEWAYKNLFLFFINACSKLRWFLVEWNPVSIQCDVQLLSGMFIANTERYRINEIPKCLELFLYKKKKNLYDVVDACVSGYERIIHPLEHTI